MHYPAVHMLALRSPNLLQLRARPLTACIGGLLMAPRPAKRQRSTVTCSMIDNRCARVWQMDERAGAVRTAAAARCHLRHRPSPACSPLACSDFERIDGELRAYDEVCLLLIGNCTASRGQPACLTQRMQAAVCCCVLYFNPSLPFCRRVIEAGECDQAQS